MDSQSPIVTRKDLADSFARLGIARGDVVLVHSSLSSLGRMEDGPDGVIDVLLDAIGPAGHAIVPTHSSSYIWPDRPVTPFDPATSPSKTGLITEVFRRRPAACRSGHPTHSVAAIGPRAQELVRDHAPPAKTFNIAGPHGRYVCWNAKILFLGVGLHSNTTYHAVEEWLALPYMPDTTVAVAGPTGWQPATINSPCGHRSFYQNKGLDLPDPVNEAMEQGFVRHDMCGPAELRLVRARDVVRVATKCELAMPGCMLCRQIMCSFCRLALHCCMRERAETVRLAEELLAKPEFCDPNW